MRCSGVLVAVLVAAFTLTLVSPCALAAPKAELKACDTPPRLDGVLDDVCWQAAAPFSGFVELKQEREATFSTTVKAAFDRTWLYFGIACAHPDVAAVKPAILEHNGAVHNDESVEIFLDPGTDGKLYCHFKLSIANVRAEQRVTSVRKDVDWDTPWRSATKRTDSGWNAEIAIPLYVLASIGDLGRLRGNVTRTAIATRNAPTDKWSSWAPVARSFHEPSRFGALKGLAGAKIRIPFLASFDTARVGKYGQADGKYFYDVMVNIGGYTHMSGKVRLTVTDRPVSGTGQTVSQELALKGAKREQVSMPMPVATLAARTVKIVMTDAETGEELQSAEILDTAALNLLSAYLHRSYYTSEAEAVAVCAVGLPDDARKNAALTATDEKGRLLGRVRALAPETLLPLKIGDLPVGANAVTVELRGKEDTPLFAYRLDLAKRAPKPGREWKIDKLNRLMLRDGKPFFAIAQMDYGYDSEEKTCLEQGALGMNAIVPWGRYGKLKGSGPYMETAARNGMLTIMPPRYFYGSGLDRKTVPLTVLQICAARKTL